MILYLTSALFAEKLKVGLKFDNVKNKSGFSAGKAAVGGLIFGPVGLLGGALGKKHQYVIKYCKKCGFEHTYQKNSFDDFMLGPIFILKFHSFVLMEQMLKKYP